MKRRNLAEINAGSMADIAFLLLIFFLVTTTMEVDSGIARLLPRPVEIIKEVEKRNVFKVLVNSRDELLINGKKGNIQTLKKEVKNFLRVNHSNNPDLPETKIKNIPFLGNNWKVSKGIVSLQNDRGTSYDIYIQIQNELTAAVNELRDELSMQQFGKKFSSLDPKKANDKLKIKAIKEAIGISISEAEPNSIRN